MPRNLSVNFLHLVTTKHFPVNASLALNALLGIFRSIRGGRTDTLSFTAFTCSHECSALGLELIPPFAVFTSNSLLHVLWMLNTFICMQNLCLCQPWHLVELPSPVEKGGRKPIASFREVFQSQNVCPKRLAQSQVVRGSVLIALRVCLREIFQSQNVCPRRLVLSQVVLGGAPIVPWVCPECLVPALVVQGLGIPITLQITFQSKNVCPKRLMSALLLHAFRGRVPQRRQASKKAIPGRLPAAKKTSVALWVCPECLVPALVVQGLGTPITL